MAEIAHFVAVPFDVGSHGLVAGEPASCPSPAAAIACAQGLWRFLATPVRSPSSAMPSRPVAPRCSTFWQRARRSQRA